MLLRERPRLRPDLDLERLRRVRPPSPRLATGLDTASAVGPVPAAGEGGTEPGSIGVGGVLSSLATPASMIPMLMC